MNKPTLTYIGHATIKIKSADGHDDHMPSPDVKVRDGGTIV